MMPKMLDAAFLYGEKRFQKKINKQFDSSEPVSEQSFEEILAGNLDGRDKIEKLVSDVALQNDFLIKAHKINRHLQDYFYLPLLHIHLDPPSLQAFDSVDIETIFSNFGQILKVINKDKVIYVLMRSMVECWLAVKILNDTPIELNNKQGATIIHQLKVQLCFEDASVHHIYEFKHLNFEEELFCMNRTPDLFEYLQKSFKFISIFEIDVDVYQKDFNVKQRILGLKGSNIVRILYMVEKAFIFENQESNYQQNDNLDIKLLIDDQNENQMIIMGSQWNKFQLAQKYANELFAQIKEEFKFFQDYQLIGLKEARVKRTDKFHQHIEIQYSFDNDS